MIIIEMKHLSETFDIAYCHICSGKVWRGECLMNLLFHAFGRKSLVDE